MMRIKVLVEEKTKKNNKKKKPSFKQSSTLLHNSAEAHLINTAQMSNGD